MEMVVQVLVKDHATTIVAECPQLITSNNMDSTCTKTNFLYGRTCFIEVRAHIPSELSLMFSLMDRIPGGVDPMLQDLETYILQSGLDDMKANADIITTVS